MDQDIKKIIRSFNKQKVLVIGDAILDTYINGSADRICREAPALVFNTKDEKYSCGGAANTALNLAALGAETFFLAVLGADETGNKLSQLLAEKGVNTNYVIRDQERRSHAKKRIIADHNIILRIDEGSLEDINTGLQGQILQTITRSCEDFSAIILSDYGYGLFPEQMIAGLEQVFADCSVPIFVDSKNVNRFKPVRPFAVKPNYEETLQVLNMKECRGNRVEMVSKKQDELLFETGAENVVVTLDRDGVLLLRTDEEPYRVNCIPRAARNTIGAGDTFISALSLSVAAGAGIEMAAQIAATAAAIVVQQDGTTLCSNQQLLAGFNSVPKYISSEEDIRNLLQDLRGRNKKIVFTNGCFDLIHKGHIDLLKKSREEGDVLIVGVNTDKSVRMVKGGDRPVTTLQDRVAVLAALESIDYIIPFDEESPVALLKSIRPDIFAKGADYTETSLPEMPVLKELGCRIKIIPRDPDVSTSNIIHRIHEMT